MYCCHTVAQKEITVSNFSQNGNNCKKEFKRWSTFSHTLLDLGVYNILAESLCVGSPAGSWRRRVFLFWTSASFAAQFSTACCRSIFPGLPVVHRTLPYPCESIYGNLPVLIRITRLKMSTFIRQKAETQQNYTCTPHTRTHTHTHCKNSKIH